MDKKKVLKNIVSSLMLQTITLICGFLIPKMIISNFGSKINGLITSITQFLAYISLLESGMGPVVKSQLYKPIAKKDKKQIENILYASEKFFKVIARIFIIYIIILCVIYPLIISKEFETGFTITLLLIISLSTFAEYYFGMTYRIYLIAEQKTYVVSYFQIISTILNTVGIIILIKLHANIFLVKGLSSLLFIIRPIFQNFYVKKKYHINLKNAADRKYKLKQRWDGLSQHIAAIIHANIDVVLLTFFSAIKEVSVYSVYYLVVNGIDKFISSLVSGVEASFGNLIAKEKYCELRENFEVYEVIYYTIISIIFSCTFALIIPFITVYTMGISDTNYIRPLFAIFIVLAELMQIIQSPYLSITYSAAHFKETKKGAWVEASLNVLLSIILMFKLGLLGVAIGTFISTTIRTIEFIYHSSKYILKRNQNRGFIILTTSIFEIFISYMIIQIILKNVIFNNYFTWLKYAVLSILISSPIIFIINFIIFPKELKKTFNILKRKFIIQK